MHRDAMRSGSLEGRVDGDLGDAGERLADRAGDLRLLGEFGELRLVDALDLTGPAGLRPFVVKGLADKGRTVLAVTATQREAEDLVESLSDLIDADTIGYFPSWETLPHERLSPRSDTIGRRLAVLRRICHPEEGELRVVVAPVRSLLQADFFLSA